MISHFPKMLAVCKKCGVRPQKVKIVHKTMYQVICVCGHAGREPKKSPESAIGCWTGQQGADIKKYGDKPRNV